MAMNRATTTAAAALKPVQASDIDEELERSLTTTWDAQIMDYPADRFPFSEWILDRIRKMGYPLDDLSYLHKAVPQPEVFKVTKQLCADTNLPEFRRMLNRFVREVVVPKGKLRTPVAVQRYMNVRIMLPTTPDLFFPYHTGLLYGHGIASRSLWMPFVDVTKDEDRSRSMQIIPIKRSRELIKMAIDNRLSMEQMTEVFDRESHQIKAKPGSLCLFTQEHIHGSGKPNVTDKTRVSMDFRIAEGIYGDLLGRKIPAGYFHLLPGSEEEEERLARLPERKVVFQNEKSNIFYVGNNTSATFPIPVHLQRYMLLDYCKKHDLQADLELFDLEDMLHLPTLWHIVEHRNVNVVMYSIFALPEEEDARNRMLEIALAKGMIMHFVNEGLALAGPEDLKTIRDYLAFSRYGKSRLPIGLPLSELSKEYFGKWSRSLEAWRAN
jgi:sporadic carbohydrate cluster protein (TIGR04323 family)